MVFIYIAKGFEEVEAVTPVDVLRRAGARVAMVSMEQELVVQGAHGIQIVCDMTFEESEKLSADMMVLPGGMPGTMGLANHSGLLLRIKSEFDKGTWIGAICAAPLVLAKAGILKGRKATIHPGMEKEIEGAVRSEEPVCLDGRIITSRGPGTAMAFALALACALKGETAAEDLKRGMVFHG
jgi:protein deglycase